jgi:hypothetical protein
MKNIALMVGEHKFIVDLVQASLMAYLELTEEKYCSNSHRPMGQV